MSFQQQQQQQQPHNNFGGNAGNGQQSQFPTAPNQQFPNQGGHFPAGAREYDHVPNTFVQPLPYAAMQQQPQHFGGHHSSNQGNPGQFNAPQQQPQRHFQQQQFPQQHMQPPYSGSGYMGQAAGYPNQNHPQQQQHNQFGHQGMMHQQQPHIQQQQPQQQHFGQHGAQRPPYPHQPHLAMNPQQQQMHHGNHMNQGAGNGQQRFDGQMQQQARNEPIDPSKPFNIGGENPNLNGMASYEQSCIFFGNIPYDAEDSELQDTFKMAGPFSIFRLKIDSERKQPKGFGFCLYKDPDAASSALRNLKKFEIKGRPLKVDFASDNKNGNNLKRDDVLFRDSAEIVKISASTTSTSQQQNSSLACEILESQNSTVDEMLENLSDEQEEMILACLKEVVKFTQQQEEGDQSYRKLVEQLAQDENMLKRLGEIMHKVRNRGMGGMMGGQGGLNRHSMNGRGPVY